MDRQLERGSSPGQGKAISPEAQLARLRAIRKLVEENNQSCLSTEMIVCQIYMESRFDKTAQAEGSSARGLIQLLKVANRELFRLDNLRHPVHARRPEAALYPRRRMPFTTARHSSMRRPISVPARATCRR